MVFRTKTRFNSEAKATRKRLITLDRSYLKMAMFCRVVDWGKPCDVLFSYQPESRAILRRKIFLVNFTKIVELKLTSK